MSSRRVLVVLIGAVAVFATCLVAISSNTSETQKVSSTTLGLEPSVESVAETTTTNARDAVCVGGGNDSSTEARCAALSLADEASVDPERALLDYENMAASNPVLRRDCHAAHHVLGEAAAAHVAPAQVLLKAPSTCGFGFLHGAVIGEMARVSSVDAAVEVVRSMCSVRRSDLGAMEETFRGSCLHAAGHEVYVLVKEINGSLDVCTKAFEEANGCTTGSFMQYAQEVVPTKGLEPMANTCLSLEKELSATCWSLVAGAGFGPDGAVAAAMKVCDLSGVNKDVCAVSVGQSYALESVASGDDPSNEALLLCASVDDSYAEKCFEGAVIILEGAVAHGLLNQSTLDAAVNEQIPSSYVEQVKAAAEAVNYLPWDDNRTVVGDVQV